MNGRCECGHYRSLCYGCSWDKDQHTPGAKLDDGKVDMSLLEQFPRALEEMCRVGTYGKEKYTRGGWLSVPDGITRYTAAMLRHLLQVFKGKVYDEDPWYDTEKGKPFKGKVRHDAQVMWNAAARLELTLREEEERGSK